MHCKVVDMLLLKGLDEKLYAFFTVGGTHQHFELAVHQRFEILLLLAGSEASAESAIRS